MKNRYRTFSIVIFCCYVAIMIVGVALYPYAPIRLDGSLFIDKRGTVHTAQEYHRFKLWERTFIVAGCLVFSFAIGDAIYRYRTTGSFRIPRTPRS